jgi:hypothetical protein
MAKNKIHFVGVFLGKTPLGVKLTAGGFRSYHAARAAGSKVLEELVENIRREERDMIDRTPAGCLRFRNWT